MLKSGKPWFSAGTGTYLVMLVCALILLPFCALAQTQTQTVRVIAFGAHPDDCDLGAGGLAAKYASLGDKVKFVSLTNGDAGHQFQHGEELAKRRRAEAQEAGRRIGIEYEVLDNHDGKLVSAGRSRQPRASCAEVETAQTAAAPSSPAPAMILQARS